MGVRSRWLVLVVIATAVACNACAAQQSQARAEEITQSPQQGAMVFQGSLVQVNTDTKMLTVKDAENKEMHFVYNDDTEIVGAGNTVQGLAGKSGERVKVTYTVKQGVNQSSRIEILPYY
jgi:hypothetical protein